MWCMQTDTYWSQCEPCAETWDATCSETDSPTPKPEAQGGCEDGWTAASWTWYVSYAACCQGNPNYDPNANTEECGSYSACDYPGAFAYASQQKSLEWVKSHDIVAFFSSFGDNAHYGNRNIRIKAKGTVIETEVLDTCGDHDCGDCCTGNAQPSGYLVDMEYWTVKRHFGELGAAQGQICWQLANTSSHPTSPPSPRPVSSTLKPTQPGTITSTTATTTTTTTSEQLTCVKSKYAQCGGAGFVGDTCCPDGMWCMQTDTYWSQCEPCAETWDVACSATRRLAKKEGEALNFSRADLVLI